MNEPRANHEMEAAEHAIGLLVGHAHQEAVRKAAQEPAFADEVAAWDRRLAPLMEVVPASDVPAGLFARIEAQLDAETSPAVPRCEVTRQGQGQWIALAPGARIKVLHAVPALNRKTLLLELAPGAVMEGHDHDADEECYVISGDITFGEHELGLGDFHLAPRGSTHGRVSSRAGCLCLIVTAM